MEIKKFVPVFIPDYPVYYGWSCDTYKIRIDLYTENNNFYQPVFYTDKLEKAKEIAVALKMLVRNDMLVSGPNHLEPFDYVVIFDNHTGNKLVEY